MQRFYLTNQNRFPSVCELCRCRCHKLVHNANDRKRISFFLSHSSSSSSSLHLTPASSRRFVSLCWFTKKNELNNNYDEWIEHNNDVSKSRISDSWTSKCSRISESCNSKKKESWFHHSNEHFIFRFKQRWHKFKIDSVVWVIPSWVEVSRRFFLFHLKKKTLVFSRWHGQKNRRSRTKYCPHHFSNECRITLNKHFDTFLFFFFS